MNENAELNHNATRLFYSHIILTYVALRVSYLDEDTETVVENGRIVSKIVRVTILRRWRN